MHLPLSSIYEYIKISSPSENRSSLLPVHQEAEALVRCFSVSLHIGENSLEIIERIFEVLCGWAVLELIAKLPHLLALCVQQVHVVFEVVQGFSKLASELTLAILNVLTLGISSL